MNLRTRICFEMSRRLMPPPEPRTIEYSEYAGWREDVLEASWSAFSDTLITGKDVLDFGCGDGQLAIYLLPKNPRNITGVDLDAEAIARATAANTSAEFIVGMVDRIPLPDRSIDTLLAFDMMEHVMQPLPILKEWFRVLRPGGRVAIEWFPFKGAWGPHMESLIPIPWAHVMFGERAMFRAAEAIYDLPDFTARHWDLDEHGRKKPNKWRQWSSFREQGFLNELDIPTFERMAHEAGFQVARLERRGFAGPAWRRAIGSALMRIPLVGEYFVVSTVVELVRPET